MSCWRQSSLADCSPAAVWVLGGHEESGGFLSFLVGELQSHGGAKQITLIGYGLLVTGTGLLNAGQMSQITLHFTPLLR